LPKLGWDNGLSGNENERLQSAGDPSEVTELIIQGLERMQATSVAPQPGALEPRKSDLTRRLRTLETRLASVDRAPGPTGNKDSHLQMIQGVIDRMGQNSFSLKGWATTVATGLFALAASGSHPKVALLALPSLLVFWLLDAYYLRLEHLYRALFNQVRLEPTPGTDYSMDASGFSVRYAERFWSFSERVFYLPLLAFVLLLFAVLTFLS